jgi:hypothetical protein
MDQLAFPVTPVGLAVPVWIGLDGQATAALRAAGLPIPAPVQARGLIDTGSDVTVVASWILRQLAVPLTSTTSTHTAAGQVNVKLYTVSLGITDPAQPPGSPWLTQPGLLTMAAPAVLPDIDVLIGLDILLDCKMLLDGPARRFTLEF